MKSCRLHVMGASGVGTTTLARALADHWSVPHADADDYFWVPSDPPYVEKRREMDRLLLMHSMFVARPAWLLSGSMLGWGDEILALCDAVVFLFLDPDERLRRLETRERHRYDGRDPDPAFMAWARGYDDPRFEGRNRSGHEAWLAGLRQPVLQLDAAAPPDALRDAVLGW